MSRRDIIIIAALVNAGLLIVLFATSLKTDSADNEMAAASSLSAPAAAIAPSKEAPASGSADEVDQMLKQFAAGSIAATPAAPSAAPDASLNTPIATLTPSQENKPQTPSFADELNTLPFDPAAAQEVAASEPAAPRFVEVTVKKGDFLDKIAKRNGATVHEIMKANHLTSTNLKIGQVLKIPKKAAVAAKSAPATSSAAAPADGQAAYYTVRSGDNPWTIARKNNMEVGELLRLNHLDKASAHKLKPGDQLRIK